MKTFWLCAAAAGALAMTGAAPGAWSAPAPATDDLATPHYGTWGYDETGKDPAVKPGDDFFKFASGGYLKTLEIPADRSRFGNFDVLSDLSQRRVRGVLEAASANRTAAKGEEAQIGAYYRAFMDEAAIEAAGLTPIRESLARIAAAKSHAGLMRVVAEPGFRARMPIATSIVLDQKNPDRYVVALAHAGLGLPEREYYLKSDAKFVEIRARYLAHIEKMLALAGQNDAAAKAKRILALETDNRDLVKIAKVGNDQVDFAHDIAPTRSIGFASVSAMNFAMRAPNAPSMTR